MSRLAKTAQFRQEPPIIHCVQNARPLSNNQGLLTKSAWIQLGFLEHLEYYSFHVMDVVAHTHHITSHEPNTFAKTTHIWPVIRPRIQQPKLILMKILHNNPDAGLDSQRPYIKVHESLNCTKSRTLPWSVEPSTAHATWFTATSREFQRWQWTMLSEMCGFDALVQGHEAYLAFQS